MQVSFTDPCRAQQQIFSHVAFILVLLKRCDIVRITLDLPLVSFAPFSQRDTNAWDTLDRVLSNSDNLGYDNFEAILITFETDTESILQRDFLPFVCTNDILEKVLPRCLSKGLISDLCSTEGCGLHNMRFL